MRYERDVDLATKRNYLKDYKKGKTRLTWAQWLRAKRGGGSKQFVRGQQLLSPDDYEAVQKILGRK